MSAPSDSRGRRAVSAPLNAGWSLTIGRVAGIPIRLHFTFLLLLGWIAFASVGGAAAGHSFGLLGALALFGSVLLHELGHSLVAKRHRIPVSGIVLYPIGGVARIERLPNPRQELSITLAGPAVNLAIAGAVLVGLAAAQALAGASPADAPAFWRALLATNVGLFVFNMVPALPMDGGRILRALLALRIGELRATGIAATVGQVLAVAFGLAGLVTGQLGLLLIAAFVFLGAAQEAALYRGRALAAGSRAGTAMLRDWPPLPASGPLSDAIGQQAGHMTCALIVIEGWLVGRVTRDNLARFEVLRHRVRSGPHTEEAPVG